MPGSKDWGVYRGGDTGRKTYKSKKLKRRGEGTNSDKRRGSVSATETRCKKSMSTI